MKILVIGATGTVGTAVINEMKNKGEIIKASREKCDLKVDITSTDSIKEMYKKVGTIDALVSTTGKAHFSPLAEMTPELNNIAVNSKLLGQINLVLLGLQHIRDNGSFTLTSGILMDDPIEKASSAAMANGGIRAFVKSAAIEMPRGIRINNVSLNLLEESKDRLGSLFEGFKPVLAKNVALAYRKSILGAQTGETYYVY